MSLERPSGPSGQTALANLTRQMVRIGVPPNMVDILNFAGSRKFEDVYDRRIAGDMEGIDVCFPSKADLIEMKQVAGRPQDLADIESLNRHR